MTICDLEIGQSAVISAVGGEGALRQHFLDMGLIPGIEVTLIKYAPMGNPMELMVSGYSLTLRLADAAQIDITNVHEHPGGRGAAILMVIFQCVVAWLIAWAVHLIGSILL